MKSQERTVKEKEISFFEWKLNISFPQSYRQFLLERGSAIVRGFKIFGLVERESEKEEGVSLYFLPGDPRRGGFQWVANYEGRVVGLCSLQDCQRCNLTEREKLKNFQGGELKVKLSFYKRETKEFYIAHLISVHEKQIGKPKTSALEANYY